MYLLPIIVILHALARDSEHDDAPGPRVSLARSSNDPEG
jgi:hypothetical protein